MNEDKKNWQCTVVHTFASYEDAVMASWGSSARRALMAKTASNTFQRFLGKNPDVKAAGAVTVVKMYVTYHILGGRPSHHEFSLTIESSCKLEPV